MNTEQVDIKTPEYVSLQFQAAGLGSRAAAFIIDSLILIAINILIVISLIFGLNASFFDYFQSDIPSYLFAGVLIIMFVLNWSYYFLLEYFTGGRTLGKKALGIRVIQENGHSITLLSSLIRNFLRIIDMLPINYLVGMLMIFFHSKHKRLGDLVAGTIVVHERRGKKKKRASKLDKLIAEKGLGAKGGLVEEGALRALGAKEWKLLKTYAERFDSLNTDDRIVLTRKLADILFPKIDLDPSSKHYDELEDMLLELYIQMKEEWEYEL
ncbi:RDD family protein [Sutcliffiella horikoshii]|uniref:RDD family protein n=1 Tax=Sutcliffiella horikoshii TaxID=79883 RepID=UPI001F27391A|nr:RDD family protein [Sutcliffiella horikoshii]MCG1020879.1 RDD family protein [Sutcliffiella horikoshii]